MLAFDLRHLAEVSVAPEKIECVEDHSILSACGKLGLKCGKVGAAFMDYDNLSVDDGLTRNIEGASNRRKPFGPVQPGAGVDLLPCTVYVNLHAIAVVLDFMEPLVALRRALVFKVASWGLMNPGISIRFDTQEYLTKARRTLEGNEGHFTYFLKISNNQGT